MGSAATVVLAAGVAGCVTTDKRSYSNLSAAEAAEARVGEIILLDKCPVTKRERPSPPAVKPQALFPGGLVADFATTAISEAIKEAKDGLSGQFLAYGAYNNAVKELDGGKPENSFEFECVTLARGMIGPRGENLPERDGELRRDDLDALRLADYPAFYLELEADDGKTCKDAAPKHQLTLTPTYLHYAQSSARLEGSGRKTVSVVIAIAEKQPKSAEKIDADAVAVYRHNFGLLEIGKHYSTAQLAGTAATQTISGSSGLMISALVTESENPSIALRALETAFESNKSDLSKAFKQAIADALTEESRQR